ncbi:MAG: quinone-dependent dihydroorotate dehydrogenase [bacterium]|nr:quinone-dependent dihydroorotate dehydrogenase [bacterium]
MEPRKRIPLILTILLLVAIFDTSYLSYNHFFQPYALCTNSIFGDCGKVLHSSYSIIFGVSLALLGLIHYLFLGILLQTVRAMGDIFYKRFLFIQSAIGLILSIYFVYLQFFVIKSLCQYCLLSALISTLLYILIRIEYHDDYRVFVLEKTEFVYKLAVKPILFLLSPEWVHEQAMWWGEKMGKVRIIRTIASRHFTYSHVSLNQKIAGMKFLNPIGLSAGYDYEAAFPQILPSIGFGFETIGTISNYPFEGNKKPRLGRLVKSKSLLVNKGFRNPGADTIVKKLTGMSFSFPLGISIGRTNSTKIAGTQQKAVKDVVVAFEKFLASPLKNSYYELNISCPNLKGGVSFYPPKNLKELLNALDTLTITKPVFVKMPIEKSDREVSLMLKEIVKHTWIKGVIFGNLQKDRKYPSFIPEEIEKAGKGNFSGKPTFKRSNELIRLAYREYGKKLIIIGCGGIFSAEDAYRKIRLGASLIQMITGMIFEGPQIITQINRGLVQLLKQDGFNSISEAIGVDTQ